MTASSFILSPRPRRLRDDDPQNDDVTITTMENSSGDDGQWWQRVQHARNAWQQAHSRGEKSGPEFLSASEGAALVEPVIESGKDELNCDESGECPTSRPLRDRTSQISSGGSDIA